MEPKLQRRIQRYGWDKAADSYEQYWQQQLQPAQTKLLEMAGLQRSEAVLEVACGTGLITFPAAAEVGAEGKIVATDISEQMVAFGRARTAEQGFHQISWLRRDAEDLQLPETGFDAALCGLGMMYFPDPLQALKEMKSVLKPGGRAVAAVWGKRAHCGWAEIFPIVDARVQSEVCPLFFQLGTGDLLKQTFLAAGFGEVVLERISTTLHYASAEDACGAAFIGGPVALAHARFDERTRQEAYAEYLDSIAGYRNGNGYNIPGEFVIVRGRKPSEVNA